MVSVGVSLGCVVLAALVVWWKDVRPVGPLDPPVAPVAEAPAAVTSTLQAQVAERDVTIAALRRQVQALKAQVATLNAQGQSEARQLAALEAGAAAGGQPLRTPVSARSVTSVMQQARALGLASARVER